MCGAVQARVNDHLLVGRPALQERISQVLRQMEQEEVARACSRPQLEGSSWLGAATSSRPAQMS